MRGGSGNAGRYRHKRSLLIRTKEFENMRYKGKKGFFSIAHKKGERKSLNLSQLSDMVDRMLLDKKAQLEGDRVIVDLGQLGYKKLLGMGTISQPMRIKVDQCSEEALRKIKEAGGEAITSAPAE
jgi:large subunit ribosomal protein L15